MGVLYGLTVYVLSKIHNWNPNPQEDGAFRSGAFVRWLDHEDEALMNRISALYERDQRELPRPLPPCRFITKGQLLKMKFLTRLWIC